MFLKGNKTGNIVPSHVLQKFFKQEILFPSEFPRNQTILYSFENESMFEKIEECWQEMCTFVKSKLKVLQVTLGIS